MIHRICDLNSHQIEAVNIDGPLLILGGRGSGKTTVLAQHFSRILNHQDSVGVLAFTLTSSSQLVLKQSENQLINRRRQGARVTTFEEFALRLLRQHGSHIGLKSNFNVLHHYEDRIHFIEHVIKKNFGHHHVLLEDCDRVLQLIDFLFSRSFNRDSKCFPCELPDWGATLFLEYCNALVSANYQDSGSLLYFNNRLLKEKPWVTRVVKIAWTHIFVDEFQDINRAQYDLIRILSTDRNSNLLVVADFSPPYHQWSGAHLKRFSDLKNDYDLQIIQLPENFQCPTEIISYGDRLVTSQGHLKYLTVESSSFSVDFRIFNDHKEEVEYIAQYIVSLQGDGKNCAVIAPTNRLVQATAFELQNLGIHPFVPENENYFESPVLRVILQILWLAHYPSDRTALNRLCHQWYLHTGNIIESQEVVTESILFRIGFLNAWFNVAHRNEPREHHSTLMLIENHLIERFDFLTLISAFFDSISDIHRGDTHQSFLMNEVMKWKNLHQELIKKFGSRITLSDYITHFSPLSKMESSSPNSLQCITIERAKGLRFEHIFFAGMIQGSIPSYDAIRDGINSQKMDEERRHCFATMTRAQKSLTMTCSMEYFGSSTKPSQFIEEMGLQSITSNDHCSRVNTSTEEAIELPA